MCFPLLKVAKLSKQTNHQILAIGFICLLLYQICSYTPSQYHLNAICILSCQYFAADFLQIMCINIAVVIGYPLSAFMVRSGLTIVSK